MAKEKSLDDISQDQTLKELYLADRKMLKALARMKLAGSDELRAALDNQYLETEGQTTRRSWLEAAPVALEVLVFLAGIWLSIHLGARAIADAWTLVFLAIGALCLGVGIGILIYRRHQDTAAATFGLRGSSASS